TFKDGSRVLGTAPVTVADGTARATWTTAALGVGSHVITAAYGGDGSFKAGVSAALTQPVGKALTTTGVSSSAAASVAADTVTFTATVSTVAPGAGAPAGTVTFKDGSRVLGTVALEVVNGEARATLTTAALGVGGLTVTAVYSGSSE